MKRVKDPLQMVLKVEDSEVGETNMEDGMTPYASKFSVLFSETAIRDILRCFDVLRDVQAVSPKTLSINMVSIVPGVFEDSDGEEASILSDLRLVVSPGCIHWEGDYECPGCGGTVQTETLYKEQILQMLKEMQGPEKSNTKTTEERTR